MGPKGAQESKGTQADLPTILGLTSLVPGILMARPGALLDLVGSDSPPVPKYARDPQGLADNDIFALFWTTLALNLCTALASFTASTLSGNVP